MAGLKEKYADKKKKKKKKEKTESEKMPQGMSALESGSKKKISPKKKKLYEKVMLNPRKKYKKEKPKD